MIQRQAEQSMHKHAYFFYSVCVYHWLNCSASIANDEIAKLPSSQTRDDISLVRKSHFPMRKRAEKC